jgi:membrane protease YdiL (CAAX protease family)
MTRNKALLYLTLIFIVVGALLLYLEYRPEFYADFSLALLSNAIFYVYTAWAIYRGDKDSRVNSRKSFFKRFYTGLFVKMVLIIAIPVLYYFITLPESNDFVITYLLVYVIYMVFETWVLYLLAGNLKPKNLK